MTCSQHLKSIIRYLTAFESKPKEIDGFKITDWFNQAEYTFEEFYNLATTVKWNFTEAKGKPEVAEIVEKITNNQDWLQTFIRIYPSLRLDLDGGFPAAYICKVRSGIEVLLKQFVNINSSFDTVLKNLEVSGDLDDFDRQLKVWIERGYRPDFQSGDLHTSTPTSHWWWY